MTRIPVSRIFLAIFLIFFVDNVRARLKGEGIIGGDDAKEGEYGYQVSLQLFGVNICGGSIIDDRYIVTAAHCLIDIENRFARTSNLKVLAGTSFFRSWSPYKVVVDIDEAFVPEEYDRSIRTRRVTGDIAVLKLKQSLNINGNPNLRKLKLPDENLKVDWLSAIVTGFGWNEVNVKIDPKTGNEVENGGRGHAKMRYAKSYVMSNEQCTRYMGRLSSKHLCAVLVQRDARKHEGVCSGDSGSPLAYDDTLIGVVSSSPTGCTEHLLPAVYTRVTPFVRFIKQVMNGEIDNNVRRFKFNMYH